MVIHARSLLLPEFNNPPSEAELQRLDTRRLLQRLGLIRYSDNPSGFYDILPLGFRLIRQMTAELRTRAESEGFQEVFLSHVQKIDLMAQSGRLERYSRDIYRLAGHRDRLILSPAHEEYWLEMLDSLGMRSGNMLPLTTFSAEHVFRLAGHRSTGGLAWTSAAMGFMLYSLAGSDAHLGQLSVAYARLFEGFLAEIGIPVMRLKRQSTFDDWVTETSYGREWALKCERGHAYPLTDALTACARCGAPLHSFRALSMCMYVDYGQDLPRSMQSRYWANGESATPHLATGGLGLGRALMMMVERGRTDHGVVWPQGFAPFEVAVEIKGSAHPDLDAQARSIARALERKNTRVLFDDRSESQRRQRSQRFIGIPLTVSLLAGVGSETIVQLNTCDNEIIMSMDNDVLACVSELLSGRG